MENEFEPTKKEIRFCSYCGSRLDIGARFCKKCGEAVENNATLGSMEVDEKPNNQRKAVYDGELHKCPNCGEVLPAFVAMCPACGHEIRGTKSATAVKELAFRLQNIEAQKMPSFEEKKSVMKIIFGRDFKEEDEVKENLRRFENQKDEEKASLIINFSVPNTKEDIMEFMILAASNINIKEGVDDVVSKAWISKLDQVYQRAEISMSGHPEFMQIKSIYDHKKQEMKNKKLKGALCWACGITAWFFLVGLLWNPAATIGIAICAAIIIIIGVIIFKKR